MLRIQQVVKGSRMLLASARWRAASIFRMPAMSPTMTEGGIVEWKVEAGKEFAAGDVLLEVETDKATIDVEAQDDGILWEILKKNGDKEIPVGLPIAYLAEPGDDLGLLLKPKDDQAQPESKPKETEKAEKTETAAAKTEVKVAAESPAPAASSASPASVLQKADANQTLLPSVEFLLHLNKLSKDEALAKIQASGPKGRLLKGDVLAYLGEIQSDSIVGVTEWIHAREHLDLSNIVLAKPKEAEAPKGDKKDSKADAPVAPAVPQNIKEFTIRCQLQDEDGTALTLAEVKEMFNDIVPVSEAEVYLAKFPQYAFGPSAVGKQSSDEIFDELLSAPVTEKRFEILSVEFDYHPAVDVESPVASVSAPSSSDIFDELVAVPTAHSIKYPKKSNYADISVKVKYNQKLVDAVDYVNRFEKTLREYY